MHPVAGTPFEQGRGGLPLSGCRCAKDTSQNPLQLTGVPPWMSHLQRLL